MIYLVLNSVLTARIGDNFELIKRKVILLYHLLIFNSTPCYTLQKLTGSVMNLANLSQEEKDKINVDLAASGVAYKERLNMPVVASEVERQQPAHLRAYFNERLAFYRERSKKLPDGNSVQYLKAE